jgi:hypothetical protein
MPTAPQSLPRPATPATPRTTSAAAAAVKGGTPAAVPREVIDLDDASSGGSVVDLTDGDVVFVSDHGSGDEVCLVEDSCDEDTLAQEDVVVLDDAVVRIDLTADDDDDDDIIILGDDADEDEEILRLVLLASMHR